jgi:hypothetical protein
VGVFVAFITVIWQIRSSSKQVQDQIKAQREAEHAERQRQKRALAAALTAEIDDFYWFFLKGLWEHRTIICGPATLSMRPAAELGPVPSTAFQVYKSTAGQLGLLSAQTVRSVVGWYNFAANFVDQYEIYRKAWSSDDLEDRELATKLLDVFGPLPKLILDSDRLCELMANELDIPYDRRGFRIARFRDTQENGETVKQALEREGAVFWKQASDSFATWHSDLGG